MTIETTGTACYGPPPLPPNKRPASAAIPRHHHTTSTYLSFQDPLDEILVISSEDLPPIDDKSKCANGQQHRRKNSLKKYKHSQTLSLPKYNDVGVKEKCEPKFAANRLISGFQRSLSARAAKGERTACAAETPEYGIPLKTFSETFSKKCEDLTACEDIFRQPFATIRSSRPSSLTRSHLNTGSLSRRFGSGEARFSLARSSSEGNLRAALEPSAPPGRLGKCLRALSGSWKNLFLRKCENPLMHQHCNAAPNCTDMDFQCTMGGMSRSAKPAAKRVPPPAVPDAFGAHRHSGSSFGSQGYASSEDAGYPQPPDTPSQPRDDHSDYGSTVSTVSGKSPGACPAGAFAFPAPLTHKAAVLYHHQLALQEDQGIDMTQSPGRDSPGSSSGSAGSGSRHSCASLDSGRASGRGAPPAAAHHAGCLCAEHADRVRAMMAQGVPDHEIIHAWLADLHLDEYAPLFAAAGYDLATMTRMTPEDLTAIGIKKPNHRKRLKAEIANLNVQENLPDYIPGSLEEWLRLLRLEEYGPALVSQGYRSVHDVTQLAWEDLEDTGIVRLGHQKKILLAIKRVKDIRAGKRSISNQGSLDLTRHQQHIHAQDMLLASGDLNAAHVHLSHHAYQQQWEMQQTRNISASYHAQMSHQKIPNLHFDAITTSHVTDMVPIQIRHPRGKSLESLEDTSERTHLTFSPEAQTFYYTNPNTGQSPWRRSYDDGDITPTNEATILSNYEGGGTLPRPRGLVRPRPVAKISATAKPVRENVIFQDVNEKSPKYIMDFQGGAYTDKLGYPMQPQHLAQMRPVYAVSPHMGKKLPPEPPKRQSSNPGIDQMTQQMEHMALSNQYMQGYPPLSYQYAGPNYGQTHQTTVEIHMEKQKSLPLSLPAYPSSDSLSVSLESAGLLPPPPAPSSPPRWASNSGSATPASHALEEQEMANKLVLQSRNGSDASFKSSSSAESDSIPFANENAGTIKQNRSQMGGRPHTIDYSRAGIALATLPPRHPQTPGANVPHPLSEHTSKDNDPKSTEPADVLNDIGNMLANLTDELDAMLEEEKRQGLTEA